MTWRGNWKASIHRLDEATASQAGGERRHDTVMFCDPLQQFCWQ
jgi:hypothetical protein